MTANKIMPRLSIITINLNNAAGLQKTIHSIINQTFSDFELIVIDGASTDDSIDIIRQHSGKINYWISKPDTGIYNAMNKGISKATGQYCLFLNSGDWLFNNNTLQEIFNLTFDEDIVYGNRMNVSPANENIEIIFPDKLTHYIFFENTIGHQSTLIKRKLFSLVSMYNEKSIFDADWEFFMICLEKHNCTYKHLDIVFCYYDLSGISSVTENWEIMLGERDKTFKRIFPLLYDDYKELKLLKEYYNESINKSFFQRFVELIEFGLRKTKKYCSKKRAKIKLK